MLAMYAAGHDPVYCRLQSLHVLALLTTVQGRLGSLPKAEVYCVHSTPVHVKRMQACSCHLLGVIKSTPEVYRHRSLEGPTAISLW